MDSLQLLSPSPRYQRLVIPYNIGEDPDAAYSQVPYEKGANLILLLGVSNGCITSHPGTDEGSQNEHWEALISCFRISGTM